jgi:hypothetical protein
MRRLLLLAPLAALVLTGCIRAEIAIRVNEEGSGTVSVLTAVDGSVLAAFAGEGGSGLGDLLGDGDGDIASAFTDVDDEDLPPGASIEAYEDGDFVGARVTVPFEAGDDVASALDQLSEESGDETPFAGVGGAFESFVLERDGEGDGWRFEAQLSEDATDAGLGDGGGDAFGDAIAGALLGDASFTVRLALPGEIVEHDADELTDGELVWHLDVLDPGARPLMARSEASSDSGGGVSSGVLVIGLLVVAGLLTAGAVGWAVRERSRA